MNNEDAVSDVPITLNQFGESYSWPTTSALRWYRIKQEEYNLNDAFINIGRRVLVKPKTFFDLIEKHAQKKRNKK